MNESPVPEFWHGKRVAALMMEAGITLAQVIGEEVREGELSPEAVKAMWLTFSPDFQEGIWDGYGMNEGIEDES